MAQNHAGDGKVQQSTSITSTDAHEANAEDRSLLAQDRLLAHGWGNRRCRRFCGVSNASLRLRGRGFGRCRCSAAVQLGMMQGDV